MTGRRAGRPPIREGALPPRPFRAHPRSFPGKMKRERGDE